MFQFRDNQDLQRTIAAFYEAEKTTGALCHGCLRTARGRALRRFPPDRRQDHHRLREHRGGLRRRGRGPARHPVTCSVVFALGLAPVYTLAADLMVGAALPQRAGGAAGIPETSSEFGGALGIAVLGAVGTAVYRRQIEDAVPAAVPPEAAQAARDTLGAAVAAGDELPDPMDAELVDAAREAFTQALQLAAGLSAAVAIGAAVLAAAQLRRVRMDSGLEEDRGLESERALASGCRPC